MYSLMNKSRYNRFDFEFESIKDLKDFVINTATDCFGMHVTKFGNDTGRGLMQHMTVEEIGKMYDNVRGLRQWSSGTSDKIPEFIANRERNKSSKVFYYKKEEKKKRSILDFFFK